MGIKEELLLEITGRDSSGCAQRIHDALTHGGLKYRGSANSQTLLYFVKSANGDIGMAALRDTPLVLSFPATFWRGRRTLRMALETASVYEVPTEGFISSSQYSAGQLRITPSSIDTLLSVVKEIIIPEARAVRS